MIEAENIRDWRDHNVVDAEGNKIGTLESVYVDTVSDSPFMIGIVIGLPTRFYASPSRPWRTRSSPPRT